MLQQLPVKNWSFFSLLLSSLISCSYNWEMLPSDGSLPTIAVPFIEKDEDGSFTAELMLAISRSGAARAVSQGGQYQLQITILKESQEKIGFRIDPQKVDGKVRHNLLASEGRRGETVQFSLWKGKEIVLGPFEVEASSEFDYVDGDSIQDLTFTDSLGQLQTVLPFSLGQLEPIDSAEIAALKPLKRRLAQKIVDTIAMNWKEDENI